VTNVVFHLSLFVFHSLSLSLLMPRILADDATNALAHDHTAEFATRADRRTDFHEGVEAVGVVSELGAGDGGTAEGVGV
jgi:hypothetical protein